MSDQGNEDEVGDEDWRFLADATPPSGWVRLDEYEDTVLSIELVAGEIERVKRQQTRWKWVIIGLQNALQGARVLALAGTDGCGALSKRSQREQRAWFDNITPKSTTQVHGRLRISVAFAEAERTSRPVVVLVAEEFHRFN